MRRRATATAVAVLVATAMAVVGSNPADACSFAGPTLSAPARAEAGGTLVVTGERFSSIEGSLGADCSGDYEFVAIEDVTVTVAFATASGPVSTTVDAPVADADGDFTIGPLEFAVPADATAAVVSSSVGAPEVTVAVVGAPEPPAPEPPAPAPPADPTPTAPRYTG